jgi:hypothetical protein
MTTALHAVTQVAGQIPGYCASGHITRTPAQIAACIRAGWQQPTGTAANLGFSAGHNVAPFLIVALIVIAVIALASRGGSRSPATSKS